ncbi:MAG: protein-glutamate O-methyltransferase CheR [Acidobacteriota bacterium]|nr:protein-glutamate O-methyltransferase CheR [Acidobacteriota bacterium]
MGCSDADYKYLQQLVMRYSANQVDAARIRLFDTRLAPIAKQLGAANLQEFVGTLQESGMLHLQRAVAEAMTINETNFFRDLKPFAMLREIILPRLIEQRRGQRRLRIWSAASSTGQEAYSLAMLIRDSLPEVKDWDIRVIGTDVAQHVVEAAQSGCFRRIEVNRGLPARMLLKYFERDGEVWRISPEIQAMCEFRQANLAGVLPALPQFDLTLLRNVLLYFNRADRTRVLTRVHSMLRDDGYLMLGSAEQAEEFSDQFAVEFNASGFIYRPVHHAYAS